MPTTNGSASPSVTLDDIRRFRQIDSKAPGHPEYHWVSGVETTTGPLGQGVATSVGMAIAQKWLADRYNRPGFEIFDYNIYAVCGDGCLMEGVASEAASLAGHLGLDNLCWIYDNNHITIEGQHEHHLHGGRRRALPRRTAGTCCASATPTTSSASSMRSRVFRETKGRPTLHHPRQPHRLRLAAQAGHRRGPRRAARRRGGPPHQARLRLAGGREVPRARRRARALRRRHRRARRRGAQREWTELFAAYRAAVPRARDRDRSDAAARAAGRVGSQSPGLPGGRQGHRRPRRLGQGAERARPEHPVVPRRLGGPRAVEQDHPDVRGRGRLPGREPGRQEPAFRHPRARDGGDRQRPVALEAAGLRRDVLHLQRLRAAGHPAVGADGAADHLRLHARRHGRRRGRPDASAGRASRVAARHSRPRRRCGPATPTRSSRRIAT